MIASFAINCKNKRIAASHTLILLLVNGEAAWSDNCHQLRLSMEHPVRVAPRLQITRRNSANLLEKGEVKWTGEEYWEPTAGVHIMADSNQEGRSLGNEDAS